MTRLSPSLIAIPLLFCGCNPAPVIRGVPEKPAARIVPAMVTVIDFADDGRRLGPLPSSKFVLAEDEWRARLTPLAFAVTRQKATELAFTGRYDKHSAPGIYRCVACASALFSSEAKFDSGTGWPSFWAPLAEENIYTQVDETSREEVLCRRCDSHLGHLFYDGPEPTRFRYCMNSAALRFVGR